MNEQQQNPWVARIAILVLLIAAVVVIYIFLQQPVVEPFDVEIQEDGVTEVTVGAGTVQEPDPLEEIEWTYALFPTGYNVSFEFEYPRDWDYQCCDDRDDASIHRVIEPTGFQNAANVIFTDYSLTSCPIDNLLCSQDQRVELTPAERFDVVVETLRTQDVFHTEVETEIFDTNAVRVKQYDIEGQPAYLFEFASGVVFVHFYDFWEFPETSFYYMLESIRGLEPIE